MLVFSKAGAAEPDRGAENVPQTTARDSMDPEGGRREGWREPRVPVPRRERDEGTGVGMGREGTGSPLPCCWQRSQVGTIKCRVKRFSRLIVISFLLIAPPQVAG